MKIAKDIKEINTDARNKKADETLIPVLKLEYRIYLCLDLMKNKCKFVQTRNSKAHKMAKIIKHVGEIDQTFTKNDIEELGQQHVQAIISNKQYDLPKVYIELKRYETYLKTLINEIKTETFDQFKGQQIDEFEYGNAKATLIKRKKYDYSIDGHWVAMNEELEHFKTLKKEREKILKNIEGEYIETVDETTGEIQKVFAPTFEVMETLRVTL